MAACGNEHTAVVGEDGSLWTWGNGSEVGPPHPRLSPFVVLHGAKGTRACYGAR